MLHSFDALAIPFSLLWNCSRGLCFSCDRVASAVGRFFVDAKQREKTYYALTNERIIILSEWFIPNVRTVNLKALSDISISVKSNGRGTITLGRDLPFASWYARSAWTGTRRYFAPYLEMIENARQVYDLIRKIQREMQTKTRDAI